MYTVLRNIFSIVLILVATCSMAAAQQAGLSELSGTWVFDSKNAQKNPDTTLVISESGPEIKITETLRQDAKAITRELNYFADGRGETNPTADGTKQWHSISQRSSRKLIVKFSVPPTRSGNHSVTHTRTEEWTVSKDGKTLKHTTSTSSSSQPTDVSSNPYGLPRGGTATSSPLRWAETRIFKRIQ